MDPTKVTSMIQHSGFQIFWKAHELHKDNRSLTLDTTYYDQGHRSRTLVKENGVNRVMDLVAKSCDFRHLL